MSNSPTTSPAEIHLDWKPSVNPWVVAVSVMLATFMVVLDSSVANVALPHIAGSLSASNDESTWVLTSYLVANAIMLPASSWISRRIGRKRLLMLSILTFTLASLLCGIAMNMPMLILARVLQGLGGGGMQPLAQSILLESFPPHMHGTAMAVYGVGVVVAPVIGPTLGGWITDSYSWRWIFYINLPIGILALLLAKANVEDPPWLRNATRGAVDYLGFSLMALWLGTLQLVLDKGQEEDWFGSGWICWGAAISVLSLVGFVWREMACHEPIVQLRILRNRNFGIGTITNTLYGFTFYGVIAILPLFLQTLLGYSALNSGLASSPRGVGSLLSMLLVAMLVIRIDCRILLCFGFALFGYSTLLFSHMNLDIAMSSVVLPNFVNGFASGFIFVPLTTMTMSTLKKQQIGNASGIYNLMRNIGGSIGIAGITALLERGAQHHQNFLAANMTAGNAQTITMTTGLAAHFRAVGASAASAQEMALGIIYRNMVKQSSLLAYTNDFALLGLMAMFCVLPVLFLRRVQHNK